MIRVLFDHQAFTAHTFSGVSKSFCELISAFPNYVAPEISIVQSNNIHLKDSGLVNELQPAKLDIQQFVSKNYFPGKGHIYRIMSNLHIIKGAERINEDSSIRAIKTGNFDVFHPTFFDSYFLRYLNSKPFVLTVHDMMPEIFPQYYGKNNPQILEKKKLVKRADAIVAISENTKKDLIDILNVPESKIHVIYHGAPIIKPSIDEPIIKERYFLYIGTRNAYKNFTKTVYDFCEFSNNNPDIKLVCTGPKFTMQEMDLFKRLNLSDKISHIFVGDQDLPNLYSNAIAMIYPSLYEGFGMPILEAFACGCPTILNNKSCFPEIAGDAAVYFESDGVKSNLAGTLEKFVSLSSNQRNNIIEKSKKRLANFSWQKSACSLAELYESVIE